MSHCWPDSILADTASLSRNPQPQPPPLLYVRPLETRQASGEGAHANPTGGRAREGEGGANALRRRHAAGEGQVRQECLDHALAGGGLAQFVW